MKRRLIIGILGALAVSVWIITIQLMRTVQVVAPLPTLLVLPSLTPTSLPTRPPSATPTVTASMTATARATDTPTGTFTPAPTPTLAVRLLEKVAIMAGVPVTPTATDFPFGTILLPAPPSLTEPLADATLQPPPYEGWVSFESDHPAVQYQPPWEPRQALAASRGQYHRIETRPGAALLTFEGEGLRIRYVAAPNMGLFQVIVDGVVLETVDAYAATLSFPGTQVYTLARGTHTLEVRSAQQKQAASTGYVVGLDAVQVFHGSANTLILPPPPATHPAATAQPVLNLRQIAAPPAQPATPTLTAAREVQVSVVIAYDENGNGAVDPAEGVVRVPVWIVGTTSNRVIAAALTDGQGLATLQLLMDQPARITVPYFGTGWPLAVSGRDRVQTFILLLTPGNQPGLIP